MYTSKCRGQRAPRLLGRKPRPLGRDRVPVIGNVDARSGRFIAPSGCAMSGCAMTVHVGQPLTRREDARLLSGRGRYVDDVHLDGMVHAALFRSSRAHGRIRSIDVAAASAVPGVIAVFTPADLAAVLKPIRPRIAAMPGFEHFLQLPLATDKVRYVGEPMAVVVATTPYIAEDAANLISADIEDLPPVLTWEQAGDRPVLIHDGAGTNISSVEVGRGDADAAFKAAYYVRRERFTVHRHTAVPLEARGLVAVWDGAETRMTVFGIIRGEFYPEDFLIPALARRLDRPVKWIEDRREHFLATNHSREAACDLEIACDRKGVIIGLRGEVTIDIGAYARGTGGTSPTRCAQFLPG